MVIMLMPTFFFVTFSCIGKSGLAGADVQVQQNGPTIFEYIY